jgi:hypothetical protein
MDVAVALGDEPPPSPTAVYARHFVAFSMVTAVLHREELVVTMDDKACGHDVVLPKPLNRWWKR